MKSNILRTLAAAIVAIGMASTVQAASINGSIGFTGSFVQNGGTAGNLATATSFTVLNTVLAPIVVFDSTGDLAGAGAPITFATPIGVNGNPPSLIGLQLWSATKGLDLYSLNVVTESQTFTSGVQLNLAGTGTLLRNGGDATPGVWQIGFGVSGSSFTWQSTSASNLPDGGTTAMLLGAALAGLGLLRRKLA